MNKLCYRQVHLDFHTSEFIPSIGKDFVAEEFVETLKGAHVNSITCFARCHHGWLYYPSEKRPDLIHPHLENKNLLLEQIEICHKHNIKVPIYTTVQWDAYVSKHHPEWLAIDEQGKYINTQNVPEPHFYYSICLNSDYRDYFKEHLQDIIDVVKSENIDGFFLDILFNVDCHCGKCLEQMELKGFDSNTKKDRILYSMQLVDAFKEEISSYILDRVSHASIFYNSSHIGPKSRESLNSYTHLELESLPSGGWGYDHFPATMRYSRVLGKAIIGMTGKFHTYWGDFHSIKNRAALEFECFNMLALGAGCSIGDQLHPNGKLSKGAYELIGSVYSKVKEVEQYCINTIPVTEIAVLTPEEFYIPGDNNSRIHPALIGAVRMLQELSYQFDIIDSQIDFNHYKLIILPDVINFSSELQQKLQTYVDKGGKVIGTYESLIERNEKEVNFYGNLVIGDSKYNRSFVLPNDVIGKKLYEEEYVMYLEGLDIEAVQADILMHTVNPYFNREGETYCSHQHAPSSRIIGPAAVTRLQNIIYFSHPIFRIYRKNASAWCKWMMKDAIDLLLEDKLVEHQGPSTLLTSLNENRDTGRRILHLLHYITEKRSEDIFTIEEIIPLYKIPFKLYVGDRAVSSVKTIPELKELSFEKNNQYIQFEIDKLVGHLMVLIE